jgi:hypothetical protein
MVYTFIIADKQSEMDVIIWDGNGNAEEVGVGPHYIAAQHTNQLTRSFNTASILPLHPPLLRCCIVHLCFMCSGVLLPPPIRGPPPAAPDCLT